MHNTWTTHAYRLSACRWPLHSQQNGIVGIGNLGTSYMWHALIWPSIVFFFFLKLLGQLTRQLALFTHTIRQPPLLSSRSTLCRFIRHTPSSFTVYILTIISNFKHTAFTISPFSIILLCFSINLIWYYWLYI